ncbi:MAG: zinc ribbon domain-containing protein [candidate division Zixibacteria bacterium]|nr:zinc ribbon domain-containing protein [candidate division Zixibacteria bacterium]MCI0597117.1 zinc ribbon domain-containing protein [candidate division Zixibacteria bacterium]
MPIYEYRCRDCKKPFELQRKMEERGTGVCPFCGSGKAEKLFSVFGVGASASAEKDVGPAGCGPESCVCGKYGGDD